MTTKSRIFDNTQASRRGVQGKEDLALGDVCVMVVPRHPLSEVVYLLGDRAVPLCNSVLKRKIRSLYFDAYNL